MPTPKMIVAIYNESRYALSRKTWGKWFLVATREAFRFYDENLLQSTLEELKTGTVLFDDREVSVEELTFSIEAIS